MESRDSTWTLDVHVLQAAARPYSLQRTVRYNWLITGGRDIVVGCGYIMAVSLWKKY